MGSRGLWADLTIKRSDTLEWESAKIRAASNLFDEKPTQNKNKQSVLKKLNCFRVMNTELDRVPNLEQMAKNKEIVDSCPIMMGRTGSFKGERKISICEIQKTDRMLVYKTIASYRKSEIIKNFT